MAYRSSGFQIMHIEVDNLLSLSAAVSAAAQADDLSPDSAVKFCKHVLPRLLVELEVARRVDERIAASFPAPPQPEEAVSVSARSKPPKAKKVRSKRRKAKGGA